MRKIPLHVGHSFETTFADLAALVAIGLALFILLSR